MTALRWLPPTRDDDHDWLDLLAAMEDADQRGETHVLHDVADEWASVWSHPETDSVFVWDGRELVAFGWLKTIPGERVSHRIDLWGGVRPSHRRRGIGRDLLDWQVDRARQVAATLDPAVPVSLELVVADHQEGFLALADEVGFVAERRFLEVARPTSEPVTPAGVPPELEVVDWSEAVDDAVRAAHTEAFADHWGSEPRSEEEWRQWYTGHRNFRPDLSRVAVDRSSGEVASFVLSAAYPQDWESLPVEAWINTVGTRRAWRGRGVARHLMTDVLARIAAADTGFERAILGVDADNPTGALGLYRSLGFEDVRAVTTLRRPP
jgi:ribosomal protein S18 acetylase RimI-like enzyme